MGTIKADSIQPTIVGNNLILRTGSDVERVRISPSGDINVSGSIAVSITGNAGFVGNVGVTGNISTNGNIISGATISANQMNCLGGSLTANSVNVLNRVFTSSNVAPKPSTLSEVGQWVTIYPVYQEAAYLPAGGTWAYFIILMHETGSDNTAGIPYTGIAAGGTLIGAATAAWAWLGMAWRIG